MKLPDKGYYKMDTVREWIYNGLFWLSILISQLAYTYSTNFSQYTIDLISSPFNHTATHYYNFLLCNSFLLLVAFLNIQFYNKLLQMVTGPTKFLESIICVGLILNASLVQITFAYILGQFGVVGYYFLLTGILNGYILSQMLIAMARVAFHSKLHRLRCN
jgi:hypothetical protein